ncbi:hypothetical protein AMATHDRAFT_5244 [Amanita thiersii Skay4041]|uniref:Uncharacterized protein n=1 Tax=Amanita thiersii Skay4041 TaxID=703135 RepID=A0A2A9NG45_9AGAR|nr:hypothetical protein AMATHDRAFT_5244 [Amanita thiersii Skay4041]
MDLDVDMDAPQISILREEDSPPPQRKAANSRKSKAANKVKVTEFPYLPKPRKESLSEEDYEEPEVEEDELIDDDDDQLNKPTPTHTRSRSTEAATKRKAPKRKPRKSEKKTEEDKKGKEKPPLQPTFQPNTKPTLVEPSPSEGTGDASIDTVHASEETPSVVTEPPPAPKPTPASKKASPRKPAASRQRVKVTSEKEKLKITIRPTLPPEDVEVASEGGRTATAPSSPLATHMEAHMEGSPEPEVPGPAAPPIPLPEETISLENVPIPIYPLPTKPFPVQPPPKMSTGTAPIIPLDKSGKKVRHWRMAHREIRGIAGGRWFTRTWVGDKESEFATAAAAAARDGDLEKGISLPKLAISAPVGGRKAKGSKSASLAASATVSAAPSRAGSAAPDGHVGVSISSVRAPTKMRIQLGPDEYGD